MANPFFSVIIPTLNEEKNLPILLASLAKQTDRDFEVTVSDCHSTDKTQEKVKEYKDGIPELHLVLCEAKNVGAARNRGAEHAKGTFFIFLDADVEVEERFIEGVKKEIDDYRLDAITLWNRAKDRHLTGILIWSLLNISMTLFQKVKPGANGPCIIISKSFFQKIKGFDEEIVFGEDFDLMQRAHKEKARFAVFSKPVVYVSTRRFDKEGLFLSLFKSIKALFYQLVFGPIKKPIFSYEMGGQYYKK